MRQSACMRMSFTNPMHFHGAPHLNGAAQDCLTVSLYGTLAFWLYGTMLLAIVADVMIGF